MITFICDNLRRYVLCFNVSRLHLTIKLSRHLLFHCMLYEPQAGCLLSVFFLCWSFCSSFCRWGWVSYPFGPKMSLIILVDIPWQPHALSL